MAYFCVNFIPFIKPRFQQYYDRIIILKQVASKSSVLIISRHKTYKKMYLNSFHIGQSIDKYKNIKLLTQKNIHTHYTVILLSAMS